MVPLAPVNVRIPNGESNSFTSEMTITGWVYPTYEPHWPLLISKHDSYMVGLTKDGRPFVMAITYLFDNKAKQFDDMLESIWSDWQESFASPLTHFSMKSCPKVNNREACVAGIHWVVSPVKVERYNWSHIAATYTEEAGFGGEAGLSSSPLQCLTIYVDGVPMNSIWAPGKSLAKSRSDVFLGNSIDDGGVFGGVIDDIRLYKKGMSPREIWVDYARSYPISYLPFPYGYLSDQAGRSVVTMRGGEIACAGQSNLTENASKGVVLSLKGESDYLSITPPKDIKSGSISAEMWLYPKGALLDSSKLEGDKYKYKRSGILINQAVSACNQEGEDVTDISCFKKREGYKLGRFFASSKPLQLEAPPVARPKSSRLQELWGAKKPEAKSSDIKQFPIADKVFGKSEKKDKKPKCRPQKVEEIQPDLPINEYEWNIIQFLDNSRRLHWGVRVKGKMYELVTKKPLEEMAWHHIVTSYDEYSGKLSVLVNGKEVELQFFVEGVIMPDNAPKIVKDKDTIGGAADFTWKNSFLVGGPERLSPNVFIDDIKIYAFARTPEEIAPDAIFVKEDVEKETPFWLYYGNETIKIIKESCSETRSDNVVPDMVCEESKDSGESVCSDSAKYYNPLLCKETIDFLKRQYELPLGGRPWYIEREEKREGRAAMIGAGEYIFGIQSFSTASLGIAGGRVVPLSGGMPAQTVMFSERGEGGGGPEPGIEGGGGLPTGGTEGGGRAPDCSLALCDQEQWDDWSRLSGFKGSGRGGGKRAVDCSRAYCDEEQSSKFSELERDMWDISKSLSAFREAGDPRICDTNICSLSMLMGAKKYHEFLTLYSSGREGDPGEPGSGCIPGTWLCPGSKGSSVYYTYTDKEGLHIYGYYTYTDEEGLHISGDPPNTTSQETQTKEEEKKKGDATGGGSISESPKRPPKEDEHPDFAKWERDRSQDIAPNRPPDWSSEKAGRTPVGKDIEKEPSQDSAPGRGLPPPDKQIEQIGKFRPGGDIPNMIEKTYSIHITKFKDKTYTTLFSLEEVGVVVRLGTDNEEKPSQGSKPRWRPLHLEFVYDVEYVDSDQEYDWIKTLMDYVYNIMKDFKTFADLLNKLFAHSKSERLGNVKITVTTAVIGGNDDVTGKATPNVRRSSVRKEKVKIYDYDIIIKLPKYDHSGAFPPSKEDAKEYALSIGSTVHHELLHVLYVLDNDDENSSWHDHEYNIKKEGKSYWDMQIKYDKEAGIGDDYTQGKKGVTK